MFFKIKVKSISFYLLITTLLLFQSLLAIDAQNHILSVKSQNNKLNAPLLSQPFWPVSRADVQHSGFSKNPGPDIKNFTSSDVVWGFPETELNSPVVGGNGVIYVSWFADFLYAISPTGTLLWNTTMFNGINSNPVLDSNGSIYVSVNMGKTGNLVSINQNGVIRWNYSLNNPTEPVVGLNGVIYVGTSDGYLVAINQEGKQLWNYSAGGDSVSTPSIDRNNTVIFVAGGNLYALYENGSLHWNWFFGDSNNVQFCSTVLDGNMCFLQGTPAIAPDGSIYVSSGYSSVYYTGEESIVSFYSNGTIKWVSRIGLFSSSCSMPSVGSDSTVYIGANSGLGLFAFYSNGTQKWNKGYGYICGDPTVDVNNNLYFGNANNDFLALDSNGNLLWNISNIAANAYSPAIVPGGVMYLTAHLYGVKSFQNDGLLAISTTSGSILSTSSNLTIGSNPSNQSDHSTQTSQTNQINQSNSKTTPFSSLFIIIFGFIILTFFKKR